MMAVISSSAALAITLFVIASFVLFIREAQRARIGPLMDAKDTLIETLQLERSQRDKLEVAIMDQVKALEILVKAQEKMMDSHFELGIASAYYAMKSNPNATMAEIEAGAKKIVAEVRNTK